MLHLLVQVPLLCSNQSGACSQVIFISLKHPREWLMIEPSKDILTVLPLHHRQEGGNLSKPDQLKVLHFFSTALVHCDQRALQLGLVECPTESWGRKSATRLCFCASLFRALPNWLVCCVGYIWHVRLTADATLAGGKSTRPEG